MVGQKAAEYVRDGHLLGLGTGSTIRFFLDALGQRIQSEGLTIRGVPTSQATADYATKLGIPLLGNEVPWDIDLAIDGADQVDPQGHLIKGGGSLASGENRRPGSPIIYRHCGSEQAPTTVGTSFSPTSRSHSLWLAHHTTPFGTMGMGDPPS